MSRIATFEDILEIDVLNVISSAMDIAIKEAVRNKEEHAEEIQMIFKDFVDRLSYHTNKALSYAQDVGDKDIERHIKLIEDIYKTNDS